MAAVAIAVACSDQVSQTDVTTKRQGLPGVKYEIGFDRRPTYVPRNYLALTFDDGPDVVYTPQVLDVLKAKGVRATFFINTDNSSGPVEDGPNAAALKSILQRIVAEGHELGNHTVHHLHLHEQSASTIEHELKEVQRVINRPDVLGAEYPKLTLFRAPFGEPYQWPGPGSSAYALVSPIVAKYAVSIGWSIDTFDYNCVTGSSANREACVVNAFKNRILAGDYGIVLMHSTLPQTAAALDNIIDYARTQGYTFKTVEEFVKRRFGDSSTNLIYDKNCSAVPYKGMPSQLPGKVEAEDFDQGGLNCTFWDDTSANQGGSYRSTAVDIEPSNDSGGGYNIGYVTRGEWLKYSVEVTESGLYDLTFRVAAITPVHNAFHIEDEHGSNLSGSITVPNTKSWQLWTDVVKRDVYLEAGKHVLTVVADAGSWNLNYIKAEYQSGSSGSGGNGGGGAGGSGGSSAEAGMAGQPAGGGSGEGGSAGDDAGQGGSAAGIAGQAGAGGAASGGLGGASGGSAGSDGNQQVGCPTLDIIDDFEDGDAFACRNQGRNGAWIIDNDGTGKQFPNPFLPSANEPTNSGDGNLLSAHTWGSGFTNWGGALTLVLSRGDNGVMRPYDARAHGYVGFAFRAKSGVRTSKPVIVGFQTAATIPVADGGRCTASCYSPFISTIWVDDIWREHTIEFSSLIQTVSHPGQSFAATELATMLFNPKTSTFDIVLDDVRFF